MPGRSFQAVPWYLVPRHGFSRLEISTRVAPRVAPNVCCKEPRNRETRSTSGFLLGGPGRVRTCDRRIMSRLLGRVVPTAETIVVAL
jgi:hypothetical protein